MSGTKSAFISICEDLEINMDTMKEDPTSFLKACHAKSRWLAAELDKKTTLTDMESEFKQKAYKNKEAVTQADIVYNEILDIILDQEPEVIAVLLGKMTDINGIAANQVRSHAIRASDKEHLSKKHLHYMYVQLKTCYDAYVKFLQMFNPESIKGVGIIPSKSGNYGTDNVSGVKLYSYTVDGEYVANPFRVAKMLGLSIKHWMDLNDILEEADFQIGDHVVTRKEI